MKKYSLRKWQLLLLTVVSLLAIEACKKEKRAKLQPTNLGEYVYAYTSGTISKVADIRLQLAAPVVAEDKVGTKVGADIFSIKPAASGEAVWENTQTILFTTPEGFKSGTPYVASVNLKKLFKSVERGLENFEFDFRTRDMFIDLEVEGLNAPGATETSKTAIVGQLYTSDVADNELVEKSLTAVHSGTAMPVVWRHEPGQSVHRFSVDGVARGAQDSKLSLKWSGQSLGAKNKGEEQVEIPGKGNFKLTRVREVQDNEQYILLNFSDPVLQSQELDGLIRIPEFNGYLRYVVDGNNVRVYPSTRMEGNFKLMVETGVKNSLNQKLSQPSQWSLRFEQAKPMVRLVGKGVIMPNSSGLVFPFEAVSLNAIEIEVFKIYNNNILQFLQVNELDGSDDLARVGRVIMQKKIALSRLNPGADPTKWNRYALDLSQMIQQDPSAIYQVRLGFRPEYSTFACEKAGKAGTEVPNMTKVVERLDANGEYISFWDSWYGINGYYDDYSWEQRENPCYPAYYNSDIFVRRNAFSSNLGLTAKSGKDGSYFVSVTDLKTTDPMSGVQIDFYDFQNQLLKSMQTDGDGVVNTKLEKPPFVVIATKGIEKGYLRLADGNSLSLSKFDVAGAEAQRGLKGFLYGERGVWRPGDTLYLNFILEDETKALPTNHPILFELFDPRGQLRKRISTSENVNGIYPLTTATSLDAPTGNWLAKVKAGGATFTKNLKIETVKPNRLKINLDFKKEMLTTADEPFRTNLQVNWLHGAPANNLKTVVEAQVRSVTTEFAKYPDFHFDDPARKLETEPKVIFEGNTDANGQARVEAALLQNKSVPGKLSVSFKTRAFEKSGDFSSDNFSIPYSPFASYTGLRLPKNQWGQERFELDKEGTIQLVSLDANGKPLSNKQLDAGVYRVDWSWWWDYDTYNVTKFNSTDHFNAEKKQSLRTDGKGSANWNLKFDESGSYLVRICDSESGHCAGSYFYVGYPWYGDGDDGSRDDAAVLTFNTDKENYNVGETIQLKAPSGDIGRILLTLEDGTRVLESHWYEAKSGTNTLSFIATKEMVPTVYAHVSLIQPHAQTKNDLPIRMYGVLPIEVKDQATVLNPVLKMPDKLAPDQEVRLEVSEKDGRPMAYTIALVDEGLLDLTRFKTPNPWESFFAKEALGVKTWDVYDQVLGAYGGELERVLSIGGDGELAPGASKNQLNRFKPVVIHLGPFALKKGQKASHTLRLPNYVGSVRTMVIAADKNAYGATEKTTPVSKPLMVLATLPRVLSPGETLRLPVDVFAMEPSVRNATVTVEELSGLASLTGSRSQSLSFSKPGDQMAYFDLAVKDRVGIAKFNIKASGSGQSASQQIELEVRNPNPYVSSSVASVLEPGQSWEPDVQYPGMPGTNSGVLEVSSIPPIDLGRHLQYLIQYPYGCLEQTISSGFPQLYASQLLQLDEEKQKKVTRNVQATIDRLRNFQSDAGGFSYWPGANYFNHWAISYAGHFMLEAKAAGYVIPAGMIERWEKVQSKLARMWDPKQSEYGFYSAASTQLDQAYRLYTLAMLGKPEMGAMNRLREMTKLENTARWNLAAAYAAAGKTEIAKQLTANLSTTVPDYRECSYTFGSDIRDRALILETLVLLGDKNKAGEMVRSLSDELSSSGWLSTQDIAYSLLAIGKFVGKTKPESSFTFDYRLGTGKVINAGSRTPIFNLDLPANGQTSTKTFLKNTSKNMLFARVLLRGQPLAGMEKSESSKLNLSVNYRTMGGNPFDISRVEQGADFVAEVTITHPGIFNGYLKELVLTQIFPSGWEIINSRMDNFEQFSNSSRPTYQDIRDDRVLSFFNISPNTSQTYRVVLNAAYPGRYYLPAVSCEAMYDNSVFARQAGRWVEVKSIAGTEL